MDHICFKHFSFLKYFLKVCQEKNWNLQTTEKSRGWLEIGRFLDQIDRVDANYFSKNFQTNERASKRTKQSKQTKLFRSFFFFLSWKISFIMNHIFYYEMKNTLRQTKANIQPKALQPLKFPMWANGVFF